MRKGWLLAVALLWAACGASQKPNSEPAKSADAHPWVCECGAHPPGPEQTWTSKPYANEPDDMRPYSRFVKPYDIYYVEPTIWNGPGREKPEPKGLTEVHIGFAGPITAEDPDHVFGMRMLHGAQLAVEEANAKGGYGGKPFKLMLHDDYNNWQEKAYTGDQRPTESDIWGAASDATVKMIYDDEDWAIFGSISGETTHIMLRVALKAEIPIVNSASTDPTIPETTIPWFFTDLQDDRVQAFTLARRIYTELGLKRVALLRINDRYGRFSSPKFRDASRRLGHPVVIEQKFMHPDTDYSRQLRVIQESHVDAIVLWTDEPQAAAILKQMRAMGMKQRVFGSYRTLGPELLAAAGPDAEDFEAVFPYDPTRSDPRWLDFNHRFEARFQEKPEQFAALAYDAMNILLQSICKAGLNRVRIQDALDNTREYDGVTGHMVFDPSQKNVSPMYLGTVRDGKVEYRQFPMSKKPDAPQQSLDTQPYSRIENADVSYAGVARKDAPAGPLKVVLFGPKAAEVAQSDAMQKLLASARTAGREWKLIPVDSEASWRGADWRDWAGSDALAHALWDEHAVAMVALNRDAAHLAEQFSLKAFVPVIALSDDKSLTETNVPWIFRMPADTAPGMALELLEAAEAKSGPNPEWLRDVLASGKSVADVAFQATGEPRLQ